MMRQRYYMADFDLLFIVVEHQMAVSQHDVKDIPAFLKRLYIIVVAAIRRLSGRRLLSIKNTPVHALIYARTLSANHIASQSRPLQRLSIDASRHILSTYGKMARGHVRLMRALELLSEHVGAALQTILVIVGTLQEGSSNAAKGIRH